MGWFSDAVDWVEDKADDAWDATGGKIVDAVEDAFESVADMADDAWEAVKDGAEWGLDVVGGAGEVVGDGLGWAGNTIDMMTGGLAGDTVHFLDDTVFDTVEYVTAGVIDVDWDGGLSVAVGIDDTVSIGASVGEKGISGDAEAIIMEAELGLTDEGLEMGSSAGVDWGPLPYVDGHIDINAEGEISVEGEIQGTIPTPYGIVSGEASGGFIKAEEGWATYVEVDGALYMPSGTTIKGGVAGSYMETEDGSQTSVGVHGSVGYVGVGSAGGSFGYQRVEVGDDVMESMSASGYAEGYGVKVTGETSYVGVEVDGEKHSEWSSDVDAEGLDADSIAAISGAVLDYAGVDLPIDADSLVSAIDSGSITGLAEELAGDTIEGFVGDLSGSAAQELLGKAVEGGGIDSLVGGLTNRAAGALFDKVGNETRDLVLDQMSESTERELLGKLLGGESPAAEGQPTPTEIVPGPESYAPMATPEAAPEAGQADPVADALGVMTAPGADVADPAVDDLGVMTAPAAPQPADDLTDDALGDAAVLAASTEPVASEVADAATEISESVQEVGAPDVGLVDDGAPVAAPDPAPEPPADVPTVPEPAPVDEFEVAIEAADQVEESLGDLLGPSD